MSPAASAGTTGLRSSGSSTRCAGAAAIAVALTLAGCSAGKTTSVTAPSAPAPEAAPKPDQAGQSVTALNDKAFRLLQEKKWDEAAAVSRKALSLDQTSSAAWFNLGKAQMGMESPRDAYRLASQLTGEKNADVEYNFAKALWLAGETNESLAVIERGMKQLPGDKDFAALRDQVQAGADKGTAGKQQTWQIDLDGDGKPDTFTEVTGAKAYSESGLTVTSATGQVLYKGTVMAPIRHVEVFQMPDGTRLAHLVVEGCPAYPQNQFLAYHPATKQVTDPWGKGDTCASWTYKGEGRFTTFYRLYYPVAGVTERTWKSGKFEDVKSALVIYNGVEAGRLPAMLSELAGRDMEVQGTEYIFATPDLYQQFRERAKPNGWTFEQAGPVQGSTMTLTVKAGDKTYGTATLTLKQQSAGEVLITAAVWPK